MNNKQVDEISIHKITGTAVQPATDLVAVEEPLEISLTFSTATGSIQKNISVTMCTPGNDEELAAGFLFSEGIIKNGNVISKIQHLASDENRIMVTLQENEVPVLNKTDRNFYSTSSCGICGKASIDAIYCSPGYQHIKDNSCISASILYGLQESLKEQQEIFESTGGIHASAVFDLQGKFIMLREDVGRHNAFDKLIGAALLNKSLPLTDRIVLLSGRASFELVQKSAMAGIRILAAVGAPSSLAVEMAKDAGITLIGFLRDARFNIYSGFQRVEL